MKTKSPLDEGVPCNTPTEVSAMLAGIFDPGAIIQVKMTPDAPVAVSVTGVYGVFAVPGGKEVELVIKGALDDVAPRMSRAKTLVRRLG